MSKFVLNIDKVQGLSGEPTAQLVFIGDGGAPETFTLTLNVAQDPVYPSLTSAIVAGTAKITVTGGASSPGGAATQVQFNNAGVFGGISGATSDGTNLTAGSGNLRATRPQVTTSIDDSNGNKIIGISPTAAAVDFLNITNGAAGAPGVVTLQAQGTDAAITLLLQSTGTGQITVKPGTNSVTAFQVQQAGGTAVLTVDTTNQRVGIGTAAPITALSIKGSGDFSLTDGTNGEIRIFTSIAGQNFIESGTTGFAGSQDLAITGAFAVQGTNLDILWSNIRLRGNTVIAAGGGNTAVDPLSFAAAPAASATRALINLSNSALVGASGNGTFIGGNTAVTADWINFQVSGVIRFQVTNSGQLLRRQLVSIKTANYPIVASDSGTVFSNAGAGGEVDFTLPTAVAGLTYTFIVEAAQTLKVIAGAATTIRLAASVSAAAGNITNATIGGTVRLTATSATTWVAEYFQGTWTVT